MRREMEEQEDMLRVLFLKLSLLPTPSIKTLPGGVKGMSNIAKFLSAMWEHERLQTLSPLHVELYDVNVSVPSVSV